MKRIVLAVAMVSAMVIPAFAESDGDTVVRPRPGSAVQERTDRAAITTSDTKAPVPVVPLPTRAEIGVLLEEAGYEPSDENIDAVIAQNHTFFTVTTSNFGGVGHDPNEFQAP